MSYEAILAFQTLYALDIDSFETDTLRRLDWVWLKCQPKPSDKTPG